MTEATLHARTLLRMHTRTDAKHVNIFNDPVELMLLNCGIGEDS